MNRSDEVEFCNLEMKFDRHLIQDFIKALIQEGYSLYWNESDHHFLISVRTGRKLIKLKFLKVDDRLKIVGDYCVRDDRLSELLEKLIGDSRGNAVVKRFRDRQIVIENIMYGEMIRQVEISGVEQKVLYQKDPTITKEQIIQALKNNRPEARIPILRLEIDQELKRFSSLLRSKEWGELEASRQRLQRFREEMLQLEL